MIRAVFTLALTAAAACAAEPPTVATFSICARDPASGEIGVAVQSKVVAVGAVVPYARAGVGAIATQAYANVAYGERGLRLLGDGKTAEQTIAALTGPDPLKARRQVGVLVADGEAATFTGERCMEWAGGRIGRDCVVQGNILAGGAVVDAMLKSFEGSAGSGKHLGQRLIDALAAGQVAGGDKRGMQSAALLVVREGWGYGGLGDRFRDLRVDDHESPIAELRRVYDIHHKLFRRPAEPGTPATDPESAKEPR